MWRVFTWKTATGETNTCADGKQIRQSKTMAYVKCLLARNLKKKKEFGNALRLKFKSSNGSSWIPSLVEAATSWPSWFSLYSGVSVSFHVASGVTDCTSADAAEWRRGVIRGAKHLRWKNWKCGIKEKKKKPLSIWCKLSVGSCLKRNNMQTPDWLVFNQ